MLFLIDEHERMVLDHLILTKDQEEQVAIWSDFLDGDQYAELLNDAFEAGSAEYNAEMAYETLLPIFAAAIDRTLRKVGRERKTCPEPSQSVFRKGNGRRGAG